MTREDGYRMAAQVLHQTDALRVLEREMLRHVATAMADCRARDGSDVCTIGPDCDCARLQQATWRLRDAIELLGDVRMELYL
jgi:hypothetical protein